MILQITTHMSPIRALLTPGGPIGYALDTDETQVCVLTPEKTLFIDNGEDAQVVPSGATPSPQPAARTGLYAPDSLPQSEHERDEPMDAAAEACTDFNNAGLV